MKYLLLPILLFSVQLNFSQTPEFRHNSRLVLGIGEEKTALRLSPSGIKLDISDNDPVKTFSYIINKLSNYNIAFLHILEPLEDVGHLPHYLHQITAYYRKLYQGTLMTNGGFSAVSASEVIEKEEADLVAFGKPFISNPDLVEKFRNNIELTPWDIRTFYTQEEEGYLDYE